MVEYARTTFASRAAVQFCRSTSSSLIVLEPELELIVNAAGRHGLSVTRDGFAFSVDGEEVCVRGWSLANLTPAVASDMASKIPGLAVTCLTHSSDLPSLLGGGGLQFHSTQMLSTYSHIKDRLSLLVTYHEIRYVGAYALSIISLAPIWISLRRAQS